MLIPAPFLYEILVLLIIECVGKRYDLIIAYDSSFCSFAYEFELSQI